VRAKAAEAKAITIKAKNGRNVAGSGLFNKRGKTTRMSNKIIGYTARGLTEALPPTTPGKNGKLVTGNVTRKAAQKNPPSERQVILFMPLDPP
jgi:hypothetical protein